MKRTDPINISELAINDYIYWIGPPSVYGKDRPKIIKITDILTSVNDPEIDFYICGIPYEDMDISNEDIKPIPLTRHRLEKNGFIEDKDEAIYYDDGTVQRYYKVYVKDHLDFFLVENENGYRIEDIPAECIKPVKYVHQLQNLLRCCGAFELANDFKL